MSSSLISSSSSSAPVAATANQFEELADILCGVSVVLGNGTVTVRRCLGLQRHSVLRLEQSAGEDLMVQVNGVTVARGEVVIVEDSTAIRVTEIPQPGSMER
jgi:flagellar motor switch protein FliN